MKTGSLVSDRITAAQSVREKDQISKCQRCQDRDSRKDAPDQRHREHDQNSRLTGVYLHNVYLFPVFFREPFPQPAVPCSDILIHLYDSSIRLDFPLV